MITGKTNHAALSSLQSALRQLDLKNQRFAIAMAMTKTAKIAQKDLIAKIQTSFDNPNTYTLNSTYVKTASKDDLHAAVKIKDNLSIGKAAGKNQPNRFLNPQVRGVPRHLKGIEKKLAAIAPELDGMMITPTKNTPLDSFGNPTRGIYNKVVASLVNNGKNRRGAANKTIFVVEKRGIYQIDRTVQASGRGATRKTLIKNTQVKRVFNIINRATYRQHLDFYNIVRTSINANFRDQLIAAIQFAKLPKR